MFFRATLYVETRRVISGHEGQDTRATDQTWRVSHSQW